MTKLECSSYKTNSVILIHHGNPFTTEFCMPLGSEHKSRMVYLRLQELFKEILEEIKDE